MFTHHLRRYIQILAGCLLCGIGINTFIIPAKLLSGGLSGLAIIFYYIFKWPVGTQLIFYNIPIVYLAYRVFGKLYAVDTIIGTILFSLCIDFTSFLSAHYFVHDLMLNSIYGGLICGIGYGLIFRASANTGGLDVVGAVIKKFFSYDVGTAIFGLNFIIILVGIFMFNANIGLFTLISMYATAEMTNKVVAGFNRRKSIIIMSPEVERIAPVIMRYLHRGVTFLHGEGGFSHQEKNIMFVVVTLSQVEKIRTIVRSFDKTAFIIIVDTAEVSGRGFTVRNNIPEKLIKMRKEENENDI